MLNRFEQQAADLVMGEIEKKLEEMFDGAEEAVENKIFELKVLEILKAEFGSGYYPIPKISMLAYYTSTFELKIISPNTKDAIFFLTQLGKKGWRRKYNEPTTNEVGASWWLQKELNGENVSLLFKLQLSGENIPNACRIVKVGEYTSPKYMMICPDGSEKELLKKEEGR